jgi:ribosomal protein S18 acetylase RimI-like enzyme
MAGREMPATGATVARERLQGPTKRAVGKGLSAYNRQRAGAFPRKPVTISLRDAGGGIVGGLVGRIGWGWLYVDWLWIDEAFRGGDHGTALMAEAEAMAREWNCAGMVLFTASFQAPGFYRKLGFEEATRIDGYPPGHASFWFVKRF